MNVNPDATVVLCYGDSNTYGQRADIKGGRWPADVRWTGVLQQMLGDNYYVIEEGLPSRTTNLEYDKKPGRNGKAYLAPCLGSHNPIDVVVLMLGTNDLKVVYNRPAIEVAQATTELLADIRAYAKDRHGQPPNIILVSPIHIDATAFEPGSSQHYDKSSQDKSHQLAAVLRDVAGQDDCAFVDAAAYATPGEDGIHFARTSHESFANHLAQKVQKAYGR